VVSWVGVLLVLVLQLNQVCLLLLRHQLLINLLVLLVLCVQILVALHLNIILETLCVFGLAYV
jgi:hypothetical protein